MNATDSDLLRRYAEEGSQDAFALLVGRHLDLVYTAARRQVRSPQLAEDVAQSVFIKLSASARQLKPGTPVLAWLYLVTRHTALKALRQEARRRVREQSAFELSDMNSTPSPWSKIELHLDEAMESLPETDRHVVLLRYFENKSLREVGAVIGTSDDAAQKRVSRAVDELRQFFARRGVAVTASGLVSGLSANAINAAPVGLGPTITTVASLSAIPPATLTAALAMTTLQKALVATALSVLLGFGLYESRVAAGQKDDIAALQKRADEQAAQESKARQERDDALARLALLNAPAAAVTPAITEVVPAGNSSLQTAAAAIVAKARNLRQLFDQMPERKIPELQLLTDDDWIKGAQQVGELDTDYHIRMAFARLRFTAKVKLALVMGKAVAGYKSANGGASPPDLGVAAPYFDPPGSAEMLARYTVQSPSASAPSWRLVENESALVDDDYDNRYTLIENGFTLLALSKSETAFQAAIKQYAVANNGETPATINQLQPFFTAPVDPVRLEELLDKLLHPGAPGNGGMGTPAAVPAGAIAPKP